MEALASYAKQTKGTQLEVNRRLGLRPGIRTEVLRQHLDRFEWPTPDEDAFEIDPQWPLERQLEAAMSRLDVPNRPARSRDG